MEDGRVDPTGVLGGGDLLARLDRWAAEARSGEAAAARARERWLRVQADESATFAGILLDLAERGSAVVVHGRGARRHRGRVVGVAKDFCALRTVTGTEVLLAFTGIASIRPDETARGALGDRAVEVDLGLSEALAAIAADRPRVLVLTLADDEGLAGELRSVGRDVATVRLDGGGGMAYVAVDAIAELRLVELQ